MYSDPIRATRVFRTMQQMVERGFGRDAADGIRIPHPYDYLDELQMIVMEDVPGTQLKEDLFAPRFVDDLQAAAHALVKIHRCPVKLDSQHQEKTDKKYQREEQIAALEDWVAKAIQVHPEAKESLERTLATIAALDHDLDAFEPTLVHASFSLREVLVSDNGVTIVDLDRLCNADPAMDLGKLLANLKHKSDEDGLPEELIHNYGLAFLTAYDPNMPVELLRRADYYYRACLLRVACRCLLQPKKQHLAAALMNEAVRGLPHS
jgi:aminoglycoside phosphotransferase (APT) family kinase protein